MTVREMVDAVRREVLAGNLSPVRAAELHVRLSALLGNIFEEIREADMAYNAVYAGFLDTEGKANRAKIRAELSQEYRRKREAHDYHKVTEQLILSLKKMQSALETEMRMTA